MLTSVMASLGAFAMVLGVYSGNLNEVFPGAIIVLVYLFGWRRGD